METLHCRGFCRYKECRSAVKYYKNVGGEHNKRYDKRMEFECVSFYH